MTLPQLLLAKPRFPATPDGVLQGGVVYGRARRTRTALPPRFSGSLPRPAPTHKEAERGAAPPAMLVDRLETGRGDVRSRLLAALSSASTAPYDKLRSAFAYLVGEASSPSFYRWALAAIERAQPPVVEVLAWGLVDCPFPEANSVFERADVGG